MSHCRITGSLALLLWRVLLRRLLSVFPLLLLLLLLLGVLLLPLLLFLSVL